MPQADPAECVMDRRETGLHSTAPLQLGPELGQREVGHRLDQPAQVASCGSAPAAGGRRARRCGAAGGAHPLHQLDRG